ncbi:MAG TPA: hypothetical protein VMV50_01610 [Candidatus Paceibacterota bacterium]|nr:hypothetical protein [Candidatus Paceibacterota bacterium]
MPIERIVHESDASDFYRTAVWKDTPAGTPLERLPPFTRAQYARAPFLTRLYRTHGLFTKVAYHEGDPFLIGRHLDDIAGESYGDPGDRPLVAFSSLHEGIEKSLWCYSKNVLPLIADGDRDITAMLAERYEIDALLTDSAELATLLPALASRFPLNRIRHVSVIGISFNVPFIVRMFPGTALTLVLDLPETGSIAVSCPTALEADRAVFHAAPHRLIERGHDLTITDGRLLPTPLVRYRTGIGVRFLENTCACDADESFEFAE